MSQANIAVPTSRPTGKPVDRSPMGLFDARMRSEIHGLLETLYADFTKEFGNGEPPPSAGWWSAYKKRAQTCFKEVVESIDQDAD